MSRESEYAKIEAVFKEIAEAAAMELCVPYLKRAITGEREACAKAIEARLQLLEGEGALDPAKSTTYVMGYCDGLIYAAAAIRRRADV